MGYGGNVDYFYQKFTTPKTHSMIIGDSRAMQGIQPQIIDSVLANKDYQLPMLNYAFTIAQAHIGPLYRKSILKKLAPDTKNGLFIISLDPWMLMSRKSNDNNKGEFMESGRPPHNMSFVSMNPNFEYLIKNYNYFHFKGIFKKKSLLHKNGWLEESNLPKDSTVFNAWKKGQIKMFHGFVNDYVISELRKKSFDTLLKNFKNHGRIYLVRTPVDKEILEIENSFYPNFEKYLDSVSKSNNIPYFNFNKSLKNYYETYDGHHINKYSGKEFTKALCDSIIHNM
ncbi:hypothetical protein GCM10022260_25150 [Gaetbulibacter aestuarii]